ncbi:DUF397 domain-containing protein [Streptomyces sp. NBC_00102]|uniref:DUF397 domain-containing protein n=1 Tax=Streptomyces sp. NBC_00102 TaxID=2975652 RepID=UPI00225A42C6|nr:DUF397 domain-containing protein [Streptomyces sp. NBC_00102]MCX5398927.1 DUF397 domain-containing protein [Streptomyces sp. NBC_00102]
MITPDLSQAYWRKSSHSDGGGTNCVEVAGSLSGVVPVRDSKNPAGPTLAITTPAWTSFLDALKRPE